MRGLNLIREDTIIAAIDFQEKLLQNMYAREKLEESMSKLIKGCRLLGVPILVTQQYTKGLGPTTEIISAALTEEIPGLLPKDSFTPIEKTSFNALAEPAFRKALEASGKKTVVVTGTETHICVLQTAINLLQEGYKVFGAVNCMSSRFLEDKEFGQIRMTQSGVLINGYESILFELLGGSEDEHFRNISRLVK